MAERITKPTAPAPTEPAPEADAASDLAVLHPERELVLAGERVVVREYGNVEWLRMLPRAEPLVASIAKALARDTAPTYEQALRVIAEHIDALLPLIAQAADRPVEWIDTLAPDAVELLLMTWWGVNAHFFVARAINRLAVAQGEKRALEAALDGAQSTPPSSPPATAPASSAATPSAN